MDYLDKYVGSECYHTIFVLKVDRRLVFVIVKDSNLPPVRFLEREEQPTIIYIIRICFECRVKTIVFNSILI